MTNIFNNEPSDYSPKAIKILETVGTYSEGIKPQKVQAIITRLGFEINKQFLNDFPDLQYILTATTGLNHIDLQECVKRNITVVSLRGETDFLNSVAATAEHSIALLLSLLRHIPSAFDDVKKYHWDRMTFKGHELKDKTLSILGMGRLGIQVGTIAKSFGMNLKCYDINGNDTFPTTDNLSEVLSNTDVVSIHLPYTSETHHLISQELLMTTNPGSYLINTSRGQILKEDDLIQCLNNGHLAGAAIDVLEHEYNLQNSPLVQYAITHNNLIITPHIGGCTYESMEATEVFIANKFAAMIRSTQ